METFICRLCGKPMPPGEYLVFASVGQAPAHLRCVAAAQRAAIAARRS